MDYNKKDSKNKPILLISMILIFVVLMFNLIGSLKENRFLRHEKERNLKIVDSLEIIHSEAVEKVRLDSIEIELKKKAILELSKKEEVLIKTIKKYKNENYNLKNTYNNNTISERIKLFSRLATEKDSI